MKKVLMLFAACGLIAAAGQPAQPDQSMDARTIQRAREANVAIKLGLPNELTTGKGLTLDGVAVQAIRTDNPLQLINPFAPKEYGSGDDNLVAERDPITGNHSGLKVLSVSSGR